MNVPGRFGCLARLAEFALQPGPGELEVREEARSRYTELLRRLFVGQPAEVDQLDGIGQLRIGRGQLVQGEVEIEDIRWRTIGTDDRIIEGDVRLFASALRTLPGSSMVDQDAPHDTRGGTEEVRTIAVIDFRANQLDEGFVDQRRCLQRMPGILAAHVAAREPAKLVVDNRRQRFERRFVALLPLMEQLRKFCGLIHSSLASPQCRQIVAGIPIHWSGDRPADTLCEQPVLG